MSNNWVIMPTLRHLARTVRVLQVGSTGNFSRASQKVTQHFVLATNTNLAEPCSSVVSLNHFVCLLFIVLAMDVVSCVGRFELEGRIQMFKLSKYFLKHQSYRGIIRDESSKLFPQPLSRQSKELPIPCVSTTLMHKCTDQQVSPLGKKTLGARKATISIGCSVN